MPDFSSKSLEVVVTSSMWLNKTCVLFRLGSFSEKDIVLQIKYVNGLYPFDSTESMESLPSTMPASKYSPLTDFKHCHNKTGHASGEHYLRLSEVCGDVMQLALSVVRSFHCPPCLVARMKKAATPPVLCVTTGPIFKVYFEISGSFGPNSRQKCVRPTLPGPSHSKVRCGTPKEKGWLV